MRIKKGLTRCQTLCIGVAKKSVKFADKPDSVHSGYPLRDCHYSGPVVTQLARCYLPAHSGGPVNVCLLGIAARRDCPFHPGRFSLRYACPTTSLLL